MPYADLDILFMNFPFFYYFYFIFMMFNLNTEVLLLSLYMKISIESTFTKYTINKNLTMWFFIVYIFMMNIYGIFPFFFSFSSHFFMTLNLAMLSYYSCLYLKNFKNKKHFLFPYFDNKKNMWSDNPLMVLLTFCNVSISKIFISMIHIITLSFRLCMNMTAGHLIMGVYSKSLIFLFFFLFYEIFASFMQSFIFYLMSNIYFS